MDINLLGVKKLGKWAKNPIQSVFVRLCAEMFVLPPFSGSSAPNLKKNGITFDFDIAET